jgi:hypothetical protein
MALALGGSGCDGCSDDAERPETAGETPGETPPDEAHEPPAKAIRVIRGTGTAGERALHPGEGFDRGELVQASEGSRLAFDLAREVHIELMAGGRAIVGSSTPAEVIVASGMARVTLPPEGSSARPPLWVGTPCGSVTISGSGDVLVAVLPSSDVWVTILGGLARLSRGDVEGEARAPEEVELRPGKAILLGRTSINEPVDGATTLEAAVDAARAVGERLPPLEGEALSARLSDLAERFDEAAGWLEAHIVRGRELDAEQRAASTSDPERARGLVRDIIAHGQALLALKKVVLTRYEQLVATATFAKSQGTALDPDPLAARAPRMNALFPVE